MIALHFADPNLASGRPWERSLVFQMDSKRRRLRCHAQHGSGKFKAIAYTAIVVFGIFCAVRLLPPYVAEYQLSDKMQDQARFGVVNRYSKEQIKVLASPSLVRISLDYTVPIDLLVYKMDLHFTPSSENKSLL